MRLVRGVDPQLDQGSSVQVRLDTSLCYDFVVSLRALFNPRTYTQSQRWAAAKLPLLDDAVVAKGTFLFKGFDTALGYGACRLIADLPEPATPQDLIAAVAAADPRELALFMLDTGETSREQLALYRRIVEEDQPVGGATVAGLPRGWAARCRRVLQEPKAVQADLVAVLEGYLAAVYHEHLDAVTALIARAAPAAATLLELLPTGAAIEQLTGGYTLGPDLGVRSVTLAPSVFVHPYMSTRVDERTGEALIVYGIPSDLFESFDPVPSRRELVVALKAMSDPNRLMLLRLLATRPMYATELVTALRLTQPTVHHHLSQLRTAGLIRQERDRSGMKYAIRTDSATGVLRSLEDWILRPDTEAGDTEEDRP